MSGNLKIFFKYIIVRINDQILFFLPHIGTLHHVLKAYGVIDENISES